MRKTLVFALVIASVVAFIPSAPAEPTTALPDGWTARIVVKERAVGYAYIEDAYDVELLIFQKGGAGWAQVAVDGVLLVEGFGADGAWTTLVAEPFTSDASNAVVVTVPHAAVGGLGLREISVEVGAARMFMNTAANSLVARGAFDAADALDTVGMLGASADAPAVRGHDGVTASIQLWNANLGVAYPDGAWIAEVGVFQKDGAGVWNRAAIGSTLQVAQRDSEDEDWVLVHSQGFTSLTGSNVLLNIPAGVFDGTAFVDVWVTFSALGGDPVPTSHFSNARNSLIARGAYDAADAMDYHGTQWGVHVGQPPPPPPPPEAPRTYPADGITAKIAIAGGVGGSAFGPDARGNLNLQVSIYQKDANNQWKRIATNAALRVFVHDADTPDGEDALTVPFTSSANAPTHLTIPAGTIGRKVFYDVFVTFSAFGTPEGTPTSHYGVAKNLAIDNHRYALADELDVHGSQKIFVS